MRRHVDAQAGFHDSGEQFDFTVQRTPRPVRPQLLQLLRIRFPIEHKVAAVRDQRTGFVQAQPYLHRKSTNLFKSRLHVYYSGLNSAVSYLCNSAEATLDLTFHRRVSHRNNLDWHS